MMRRRFYICFLVINVFIGSCKKSDTNSPVAPAAGPFRLAAAFVDGNAAPTQYGTRLAPEIKLTFDAPVDRSTIATGIILKKITGGVTPTTTTFQNADSVVIIQPSTSLTAITKYRIEVNTGLKSVNNTPLSASRTINFITQIDSSDKFPVITDNALLDKVQQQTFKYFWDFAHPVSGLARERNSSGEIVTSGGSGFGIMAIPVAISRSFISRADGLARMQTIVGFLKNNAEKFHGAFPHWLNGATGAVIPFSANDNGADLVETAYLMQGLICARQYFNGAAAAETTLRADINILWNGVEWDWFRQNNQDVLYWHWSPSLNWIMNVQISGWNECLITYILGASSPTFPVPRLVYDNGWARNGAIRNNTSYYGYPLPLGPPYGGPLFFAHYSFLGVNPNQLSDVYADYWTQNRNHTLINYNYCVTNPQQQYGYSNQCWGLTASDIENGYTASSPTNDVGVIAPTAALSSFPYTPAESMAALKFFYYKLGDKIWSDYGFVDAFSLKDTWFASSTLAIDQGPIILMIENYRTGLLWDLFTSAPEIKSGMLTLGFTAPYL